MNEREFFKKTFDAVPAPEYLAARAAANADSHPRRAPSRALRTAMFIVLAVALLSACAVAVQMITNKPDLITQCNIELDTLRELGLFHAEFEVTAEDSVPDYEAPRPSWQREIPELPEDKYEGIIRLRHTYNAEHSYSYDINVDADTGKIAELSINARPQENWIPKSTGFVGNPGGSVIGSYDNYDAILDPEMTLGQMCSAWAQYQGYKRYELPMDATDDVKFIDARELAAWNFGYGEPFGLTAAFYRSGKREPEYYSFNYAPTGVGPYFIVESAEGPYVPEDITLYLKKDPAEDNKRSAVKLINAELDALRELGLLRSGLEVTLADCDERSGITAEPLGEEAGGKVYLASSSHEHEDCNYCLCYDVGTGKLDWLALCPKPADGSLSVADAYDAGFGAVMDEELSLGEYCELWAAYQGYERWELPVGVDASTRYLDAHTLVFWDRGIKADNWRADGLAVSFYRPGSDEPEYAYVKYGPSSIGPCVAFGGGYMPGITF